MIPIGETLVGGFHRIGAVHEPPLRNSSATSMQGGMASVPPAESAECFSRDLAARTVNCPYHVFKGGDDGQPISAMISPIGAVS
jgi:hypothetical protein